MTKEGERYAEGFEGSRNKGNGIFAQFMDDKVTKTSIEKTLEIAPIHFSSNVDRMLKYYPQFVRTTKKYYPMTSRTAGKF